MFLPTWLIIVNRFRVYTAIRILCYYVRLYVLTVMRNDSAHRWWSTRDRCKSYGVHYPGRTWPIARTHVWPNRAAQAYNAYRSSTNTSACATNTATRLTTAVAAAAINRFRSTVHRSYTTPATKCKKGMYASLPYTTTLPTYYTAAFSSLCCYFFKYFEKTNGLYDTRTELAFGEISYYSNMIVFTCAPELDEPTLSICVAHR